MTRRRHATKNPTRTPASTSSNEIETDTSHSKHHQAEVVRMQSLIDQLTKEVKSLSSQLEESQKARSNGMMVKLAAHMLLSEHPHTPLKALWEALQDKEFAGPELALAIATHDDCGVEREWDDSDLDIDESGWYITSGATALHLAVYARRPDVVVALLEAEADAGATDTNEVTALHYAAANDDLDSIQALLASGGAAVGARDAEDMSCLDYAADNGHLNVLEVLYAHIRTTFPDTYPLHEAARKNKWLLNALIELGADVDARNENNQTLLHVAAHNGAIDCVRALIANGADCDAVDVKGRTALHISAIEGGAEVLTELLQGGASPTLLDKSGRTPLHHAVINGSGDVIKCFPQHCIDFPCEFQLTPLHYAIRSGNEKTVKALLSKGISTEMRDGSGWTLLQLAVWKGYDYMVSTLIKNGADIKQIYEDEDRLSLLHVAAAKGNAKMVEVLLDAKANCKARCRKGYTPLHYAVKGRHLAVIKLLLGKGVKLSRATLSSRDNHGQTPLHLMASATITELVCSRRTALSFVERFGEFDDCYEENSSEDDSEEHAIICLLLQKGAPIDAQDNNHNTLLHLAAAGHDVKMIKLLTSKGADKTLKNKAGSTPLQVFTSYSHLHAFSAAKFRKVHSMLGMPKM